MQPNKREYGEERSLSGLFSELTKEMTSLMRHEIALARAEINEKISQAGSGATSLAVGALIAYAGLLVLLAAAVFALATIWPAWAAALVVGLIVCILGGVLLAKGRAQLKADNLKPQRTAESLRHDRRLVREHVR